MCVCGWVCERVQDEKWSHAFDPRLQSLLSELEAGLGSVLRHTHPKNSGKKTLSEEDVLGECVRNGSLRFAPHVCC